MTLICIGMSLLKVLLMAITFIGAAETAELQGAHGDTTFTVAIPGSGQANDYIIIVGGTGSNVAVSLPSGWTDIGGESGNFGSQARFAGILDTAGTLTSLDWTTFGGTDDQDWGAYATRFRGVDPTTPLDGVAPVANLQSSGLVYVCPDITSITNNAAIVRLAAGDREELGDPGTSESPTQNNEFHGRARDAATAISYAFGWLEKAIAGAAGTVTWTADGEEGGWVGSVVLRPASGFINIVGSGGLAGPSNIVGPGGLVG